MEKHPRPGKPHGGASRPKTVNELCDRFAAHAKQYYRKPLSGRPTGEATNMHYALLPLREVAGAMDPGDLAAEVLCECQDVMIEQGLSRKVINDRINRIRRVIRWATKPPRRWVTADVVTDLQLVEPLKKGRTPAKEYPRVAAVAWEIVSETVARLDLETASMIEVQWYTGMRPRELCEMDRRYIEDAGDLMIYKPVEYKTDNQGDDAGGGEEHERTIVMGPLAQAILRPWLRRCQTDRLWSLSRSSYYGKIRRYNERHGIPHWYPNQIRHAFATRMRKLVGLEDTRPLMGHSKTATTEIYAEIDQQKMQDLMRKFG